MKRLNVQRRKSLAEGRSTSVVVDCTNMTSHLRMTLSGNWSPANGKTSVFKVRQLAIEHSVNRLLLDMTRVSPPDSLYARFDTGVQTADDFGDPLRVAVFCAPELISQFEDDDASNRNARLRVFADEQAALEWLLTTQALSTQEMRALFATASEPTDFLTG